jgi:hypothetical protein
MGPFERPDDLFQIFQRNILPPGDLAQLDGGLAMMLGHIQD